MNKLQFFAVVFAPYAGTIERTYKSVFHIEPGDFAVVDTPTNGYQVVQIRSVVDEPSFQCKWLVQRVDLTEYKALKAKSKPQARARV